MKRFFLPFFIQLSFLTVAVCQPEFLLDPTQLAYPSAIKKVNDIAYFSVNMLPITSGYMSRTYLYETKGTKSTTKPIYFGAVSDFEVMNDKLYFGNADNLFCKSGETVAFVKKLTPQDDNIYIKKFIVFGSHMFIKCAGMSRFDPQYRIISDGSAAGTATFPFHTDYTFAFKENLYFTDYQGNLYRSDGTETGTVLIKQLGYSEIGVAGYDPGTIFNLLDFGNAFYFVARDTEANGRGLFLWRSDGTEVGTTKVFNFQDFRPYGLTKFKDQIYFVGGDATHNYELWRSDGTETGTGMVINLSTQNDGASDDPFFSSSVELKYYLDPLTVIDNFLYFSATDGSHGYELWKSDGTASGTQMVEDFRPGPADFSPRSITKLKDRLFLVGEPTTENAKLFEFNGTSGSQIEGDYAIPTTSHPQKLVVLDSMIIFKGGGYLQEDLYVYDIPDIVTALEEEQTSGILVYPNPTKGTLRITSDTGYNDISIYDLSGHYMKFNGFESSPGVIEIDISTLSSGMYVLKVGRVKSKVFRIIKY